MGRKPKEPKSSVVKIQKTKITADGVKEQKTQEEVQEELQKTASKRGRKPFSQNKEVKVSFKSKEELEEAELRIDEFYEPENVKTEEPVVEKEVPVVKDVVDNTEKPVETKEEVVVEKTESSNEDKAKEVVKEVEQPQPQRQQSVPRNGGVYKHFGLIYG